MKLKIEVATNNPISGISVAIPDVPLVEYKHISKSEIDEVLCKAVEIAFKGIGKTPKEALAAAEAICYGKRLSQSTCQEGATTPSVQAESEISEPRQ